MPDETTSRTERQDPPSPTLRDVLVVVFRQRRVASGAFLSVLAVAVAYALLATSYQAHMKILLRHGRVDPVVTPEQQSLVDLHRSDITEEELNSEIELLRDDTLLRKVVEQTARRARTLLHTWLGVYYGLLLHDRGVDHIHVHHGYYSSWIAMVAARTLGIPFSMTLHGSDLLMQAAFMRTKLRECEFCITVSKFNREHILAHYPSLDPKKVLVQRMGVEVPPISSTKRMPARSLNQVPILLAVGRLHPVKNHVFLLQACFLLRECGVRFRCVIVGAGPEREKLEFLIHELKIADVVRMVGHVPREHINEYYESADLVVLTRHSEGIPLVLMEAMARGKIVLAPAITGIPELVESGKTGFLYAAGDLEQFVWQLEQICKSRNALESIGRAAREHVLLNFEQHKNLAKFADVFVRRIAHGNRSYGNEDLVLQNITFLSAAPKFTCLT
jgi:glycosyltransferase involved in cell wall biosynthesis